MYEKSFFLFNDKNYWYLLTKICFITINKIFLNIVLIVTCCFVE